MSETAILSFIFFSVLIASGLFFRFFTSRSEVSSRFDAQPDVLDLPDLDEDIRGLPISEAALVQNYYSVIRSDKNPNSLPNRLIRAGYFSSRAPNMYQLIRAGVAFMIFLCVFFAFGELLPSVARFNVFMIASIAGAFVFFLANVVLEKIGDKREVEYRKLFPDFMDTLIVCIDAGMSVEASVDRVSKEFLKPGTQDFGLHLAIMMLEVRGGRRLRDALQNFAKRLRIEEAQSLAVLFRQSEELGASVTKTLRVFSSEMREKRMIRAEEKANLLPLKMLFPLATFLFPISVLIVLIPIMIKIVEILKSLGG